MTDLDTLDLSDGSILTITTPTGRTIVSIELEGDYGLFWAAKTGDLVDTDRAVFDTTADRDAALRRTVGLYLDAGYTLEDAS